MKVKVPFMSCVQANYFLGNVILFFMIWEHFSIRLILGMFKACFHCRTLQITHPLNRALTDHNAFPWKPAKPFCCSEPGLSANKHTLWSSIFWFIQLHYGLGISRKKVKPQRGKTEALGR